MKKYNLVITDKDKSIFMANGLLRNEFLERFSVSVDDRCTTNDLFFSDNSPDNFQNQNISKFAFSYMPSSIADCVIPTQALTNGTLYAMIWSLVIARFEGDTNPEVYELIKEKLNQEPNPVPDWFFVIKYKWPDKFKTTCYQAVLDFWKWIYDTKGIEN